MPDPAERPTDDQLREWASLPTFNNCAPHDQQRKRNRLVILAAELLELRAFKVMCDKCDEVMKDAPDWQIEELAKTISPNISGTRNLAKRILSLEGHLRKAKITQPEELERFMVWVGSALNVFEDPGAIRVQTMRRLRESFDRLTRTDSDNPSDDNPEQQRSKR